MTEHEAAATAKRSIRVLVADDQAIVRKGIRALLAEVEGIEVVGEACNGQEAVDQAQALVPRCDLDGPSDARHGRHRGHPPDYCAPSGGSHPGVDELYGR